MGNNSGQPWTAKEIRYVQDNYKNMTTKQLALKLGRGYGGVAWKINQMGLKKEPTYKELQNKSTPADRGRNGKKVRVIETTSAVPVVEPKKPWWKFWA